MIHGADDYGRVYPRYSHFFKCPFDPQANFADPTSTAHSAMMYFIPAAWVSCIPYLWFAWKITTC